MKARLKKYYKILLAVIILLICGLVWWNNQWVMKINGQKISEDEYGFYQKIYPGLDEKDLEKQIVEDKVQLQQAKKLGFEAVDNYKELIKNTQKINQENQNKVKKNQVVYGLLKYDEKTYYAYALSNSINDIKKTYQKAITDKKVKKYYNKYFEKFREVENKEFYRLRGDEKKLKSLIAANRMPEQLEATEGLDIEKVQLKESTMRDWLKYYDEEIRDIVPQAAQTWSAIYGDGKKKRCYYCISTKEGPIQPLEDVSESIRIQLEKDYYQNQLKKWVNEAKIDRKN